MSKEGQLENLPRQAVTKALVIFVLVTAILSLLASKLVIDIGLKRHYMVMLMWTPGIGALVACKLSGIGVGSLGWSWGRSRWQLSAYLLPLVYGLIAYGILWGGGLGGVLDTKFIEEAGYHLGLVGWSETATLMMAIFIFAVVGMTWHLASALGEEIGWRGFLTPALMRYMSFPFASLLTGLMWAAWHLPIILFTKYNAGPGDMGLQVANFALLCVGISFIMSYLRLVSGSLWTAAVMHAAHNIFILSLLDRMTIKYDDTWRFAGEFGFILPLVVAAFALYVWRRAHKEGFCAGPGERKVEA
ncbi:CPBP family intramembrane glutamic endopeptidase [Kordiimonas aestuarii]|uniref:CPBP family intramembrane glutamic endopeptidase n=1 Tax=Kordiimonas aestuarii TaxID=1005925 RepID=UPI0021CFE7A5|nr:CPBP family intramembrane glutamic endopeptidase [Kordiimonas aestuarii]